MKKIISFLLFLMTIFMSITPVSAADTTEESLVKVTESVAINMAKDFAEDIAPGLDLEPQKPVKIYDANGKAIGYNIDYICNSVPYGYVIFDFSLDDILSEYSIMEEAISPYRVALQYDPEIAVLSLDEELDMKIYKLDMLTYGVSVDRSSQVRTNTGETVNIDDKSPKTRSTPSSWDDIFIESQAIRNNYTITKTNYLDEYFTLSEPFVEQATGHYACAVSAMAICADYYMALDYGNFKTDYMALWDASFTTTSEVRNGITYGGTWGGFVGPALTSFCKNRGIVLEFSFNESPTYSYFCSCIDRSDIGIIYCAITTSEGKQWHAMAVEGYATLKNKNSASQTQIQTLIVFDGWGTTMRNLNFDFNAYGGMQGNVFFQ